MTRAAVRALHAVDQVLAAVTLRLRRERPAVLSLVFHAVFADEREVACGLVDPFQPLCVAELRRLIEYFLVHGYAFVTPRQIAAGLDVRGRYVLLTFDDGYANNLRALPVLREFQIPATFFISSNHVAEGRAFWWDALYRERHRRGVADVLIRDEQAALKRRSCRDVDAYLRAQFGAGALQPAGDMDRPLSPAELRQCAAEPQVTLGNHTADHAILTGLDDEQVRAQVRTCQSFLRELTGSTPEIIAYPNGDCDRRIVELVRADGVRLGVSVEPRKNRLPLTPDAALRIARYAVPGGATILDQCARCRSDVQLSHWLRRAFRADRPLVLSSASSGTDRASA